MSLPCINLYPGDWLRDDVAGCSLAAQGLWLRMMFVMHDSDRYGYLSKNGVAIPPEHVARRCGVTPEQYTTLLAELDSVGVPRRTSDEIIYSKRMVEDAKLREVRAKSGSKGGKQNRSKLQAKHEAKPKQNTENEDENEKEVKAVKEQAFPSNLQTSEFQLAWADWERHRAEIKKPLKPTMRSEQLKLLSGWGATKAVLSLRKSIQNGWQGIFEPDQKQTATATAPPPLIGQKPDAYERVRQRQLEEAKKEYLAKQRRHESTPKPIGEIAT